MSTIQEIKKAAQRLSDAERNELAQWLTDSKQATSGTPSRDWQNQWTQLRSSVNAAVGTVTWTREELHAR